MSRILIKPAKTISKSIQTRWKQLPPNVRGALLVSLAGLLLVTMTTLVKGLGQRLHSLQVVFFRCLIGFLFLSLLVCKKGVKSIYTQRPFLHVLRSSVGISAMFCMFYAVRHMPIADATAILFSRSLFIIVLASLFLGEVVRWRHAVAIVIGFGGILLMTRPGSQSFQPVALVAASGSFFAAFVVIIIKKLAKSEPTLVIMFYYTFWTSVLSLIPALFVWQRPTAKEMLMLILIGVLGVVGQTTVTNGFRIGEASVVVPFDYLRLVYATLYGVLLFSEVPGLWSIVGSLLIVLSNLYILFLKRNHNAGLL